MRKLLHKVLILGAVTSLAACQSTTDPVQKTNVKSSVTTRSGGHLPPPVKKSIDGVQDVTWQITSIRQKRAKFFSQVPFFTLGSATQTLRGHTGCNALFGRYAYNYSQQLLDLDIKAGHQSCDGALAQEAELVDALQRVKRFRIQGNEILLMDQSGQILLQAQKK